MFDLLKKKIGGFIDNIVKKTAPEPKKIEEPEVVLQEKVQQPEQVQSKQEPEQAPVIPTPQTKKPKIVPQLAEVERETEVKIEPKVEKKVQEQKKPESIPKQEQKAKQIHEPKIEQKPKPEVHPKPEKQEKPESEQIKHVEAKKETKEKKPVEPKKEESKKEEPKVKLGVLKQVTSIFTGEVEITEKEIADLLETLELELLESDVAIEVAEEIKSDLRQAIAGRKVKRGELNSFVKETIRKTLIKLVSSDKAFDIIEMAASRKPLKIIFLGVNGAGKTTTIAKVAKMFINNGKTVVFASADTFRAAAIEQMQVHADRLGVRNIKRDYGSDPTAVAYDAVNYAKAHGIDVVLIDTAGRQETDLNLINELKKLERVIQPDIKMYIGESIAGNAIISQVQEFNDAVKIDGVILTKLDCDAKGGTVLSITKSTGIPIVYVGTGQKYEDIEKFDAEKIIELILG